MTQHSVRIPADVEREDRVLAGLTARQVAILAVTGLAVWLLFVSVGRVVPVPVFGLLAIVLGTAGAVLALGRRDGLSADRYLLAAWKHARSPRRQVLAPDGFPDSPEWLGAAQPAAGLVLPAEVVRPDGVIELAGGVVAVMAEASTVGFAFRAAEERRALVAAFARWLNSLGAPVQIVVRSQWVDLSPLAALVADGAATLPHPALEAAAREHAAFLSELGRSNDLLRRQVLLVFTEPGRTSGAADRVVRRVEAAARTLAAAETSVRSLDAGQAAAVLAVAANPLGPLPLMDGWAAPDQVVTTYEGDVRVAGGDV